MTHSLWISSRCELDVSVRSDCCSGSVCPLGSLFYTACPVNGGSEDSLTGSVCLSRHTHHRQDRRFPFLSQRDWFTCWRWQSLWNRQREEQSQCLRLMTVLSDSLVHLNETSSNWFTCIKNPYSQNTDVIMTVISLHVGFSIICYWICSCPLLRVTVIIHQRNFSATCNNFKEKTFKKFTLLITLNIFIYMYAFSRCFNCFFKYIFFIFKSVKKVKIRRIKLCGFLTFFF